MTPALTSLNHPSSQQIESATSIDPNAVDDSTKINKSSSAHQMISSSTENTTATNNLITNSNSSSNIPLLNSNNNNNINQTVNSLNMINNNNSNKIEPANMRIIETRIDANDIISQIELELTNRIANSAIKFK
jgi:hypothetical protein